MTGRKKEDGIAESRSMGCKPLQVDGNDGLEITMRKKGKLYLLALRGRECENKQPPLRGLQGGGGLGGGGMITKRS